MIDYDIDLSDSDLEFSRSILHHPKWPRSLLSLPRWPRRWDLGYLNSLRWLEIAWMMDLASQGRAFMYTTLNLAREKAKYFP